MAEVEERIQSAWAAPSLQQKCIEFWLAKLNLTAVQQVYVKFSDQNCNLFWISYVQTWTFSGCPQVAVCSSSPKCKGQFTILLGYMPLRWILRVGPAGLCFALFAVNFEGETWNTCFHISIYTTPSASCPLLNLAKDHGFCTSYILVIILLNLNCESLQTRAKLGI